MKKLVPEKFRVEMVGRPGKGQSTAENQGQK